MVAPEELSSPIQQSVTAVSLMTASFFFAFLPAPGAEADDLPAPGADGVGVALTTGRTVAAGTAGGPGRGPPPPPAPRGGGAPAAAPGRGARGHPAPGGG